MPKNLIKFFFHFAIFIFIGNGLYASEDYIIVEKKNVTHKFVRVDDRTDHFTQNIFHNWENDTFDVFDQVKNKNGIAIDIGAWIGTTAIWLSNNFHHVIAVEADKDSIICLDKNLKASDCNNVSICGKPVFDITKNVVFGPRGNVLNESISYVKSTADSNLDYEIKSITFKQLIFDYVCQNQELKGYPITFIKCDIEGGEENILEDILHFAHHNNCKVYMSFHASWWKTKSINDFEYLFKYFKTNCPIDDVCQFIRMHPFASLLFEPIPNAGPLMKENITAVVIGYNQSTFIKNMVAQLERFTSDIVVIDNNSTFKPLLDYYQNDFKYTLLKQNFNHGHLVYALPSIQQLVGDIHILTDPDLRFNPNLPGDFIKDLISISNYFEAERVGFALDIFSDDIRTDIVLNGYTIKGWENQFWANKLLFPPKEHLDLYAAPIDTTFCLFNRRFKKNTHIRIGGDFTCTHIPWVKGFQNDLEENEYETYLEDNRSSNWYKVNEI